MAGGALFAGTLTPSSQADANGFIVIVGGGGGGGRGSAGPRMPAAVDNGNLELVMSFLLPLSIVSHLLTQVCTSPTSFPDLGQRIELDGCPHGAIAALSFAVTVQGPGLGRLFRVPRCQLLLLGFGPVLRIKTEIK
jgi:hypothetical protein